jgi:hypothetical protein
MLPRPELRDLGKERYWRRVLGQCRQSVLTARDFCAANGLSEPSFYGWKREIARRDEERTAGTQARTAVSASRRSAAAALPAFVPVRIEASAACALEVVVAGGRLVRVRPGFDAAVLRQLLAVLEEPPC